MAETFAFTFNVGSQLGYNLKTTISMITKSFVVFSNHFLTYFQSTLGLTVFFMFGATYI